MPLLEIRNLVKRFGGITAVAGIDLEVRRGEVVGVIGPNGSGKTTLMNLINGIIKPDEGEIIFQNHRIAGFKPHKVATLGMARTFQITKVFNEMTVLENLLATPSADSRWKREERIKRAVDFLRFVGLEDKINEAASTLSGGQKKLLEFARALMLNPTLMLLDEPFAGVHVSIVTRLSELIERMKIEEKTFIIVSHDIHTISRLSDRVVVMNEGKKIAEGKPAEVSVDREVIRVYLGE
ncbi:MAG TPA: ABC transporter ATP-binding protein [Candidatus Caldiarchaeum subterraneum]|uniref:ABC transporter ATP-binding protein n=1 Tax=Caldiarchaeum subterraneum TaxID=311458 RepID=A0A833EA45_CALS0|nr:ABC transporter ATP-binding protein [Aigarchaeota archaeon]HIQ29879.1 ABC transporter ATP-binding protein [Candidatus Caldarchaeum subterraneum]